MKRREYLKWQGAFLVLTLSGCGGADDEKKEIKLFPAPEYPIADKPYTTLSKTLVPLSLTSAAITAIDSKDITLAEMKRYSEFGIGDYEEGPGQEHRLVADLAGDGYTLPETRRSLLYFPHYTDVHIIDEETPVTFGGLYEVTLGSTFRPQAVFSAQIFDSAVRTANAFAVERPFDFVLITGDLTDHSQTNEIRDFLRIADGGRVDPDYGIDDDPVPGPGNDGNDPLTAAGFKSPYYLTLGNHETQLIGTFKLAPEDRTAAVGDTPFLSFWSGELNFRDGSTEFAEVKKEGKVPPDPEREIADFDDITRLVFESKTEPIGHGLTEQMLAAETADYVFDPIPGAPIRVISMDTRSKPKYDEKMQPDYLATDAGIYERAQFDNFLVPELQKAISDGVLVVVSSHHSPAEGAFHDESPVSAAEITEAISACPNVVLHLAGHTHHNKYFLVNSTNEAGSYLEMVTSSMIDWPNQFRIIEIVDNGDNTVSVIATAIDYNAPAGSLAEIGRKFSNAHQAFLTPEMSDMHQQNLDQRNVEVVVPITATLAEKLGAHQAHDKIESLTTLKE